MHIPADMHKWQTRFAWQMTGFAIVMLFLAGLMMSKLGSFEPVFGESRLECWNPQLASAVEVGVGGMGSFHVCQISISTRGMREDERAGETLL